MIQIFEFGHLQDNSFKALCDELDKGRLTWCGYSLASFGSLASRYPVECQPFSKDTENGWKASHWVGRFAVDGNSYAIVPRIGWARFEAMLEDVLSVGVAEAGDLRRGSRSEGDLASLAWMLVHREAWRRHGGAAKAFVRREVRDAPILRGELDLAAQLAKLTDRHTLACRYDELTYDHPVNRGTMLVLKKLQQHGRFPFNGESDFRRRSYEWRDALTANGVATLEHFPREPMRWSRANDGFRSAHALAEIVVAERQVRIRSGKKQAGFLFDSAEVWELYLYRQLRNVIRESFEGQGFQVEWPRGARGPAQALLQWNNKSVEKQIPDIVICRPAGKIAMVLDAKYRVFRPPDDDTEIAWQMFGYAAMMSYRYRAESWPPSVLIYPACNVDEDSQGLNPRSGNGPHRLGQGQFQVADKPPISAWAIELPALHSQSMALPDFHSNIRTQLRQILEILVKELPKPR